MRHLLAACMLVLCATAANAQKPTYPLNRSPMQKQADYIRSQNPTRVVPKKTRGTTNIYFHGNPYRDHHHHHHYGRYGRYRNSYPPYYGNRGYYGYGGYYGPVIYPPVIRTWPITPYPFRIP